MKVIILAFLTLFYSGFSKPFPGTIGSFLTVLIIAILNHFFTISFSIYVLLVIIIFFLGVYLCNYALSEKFFSGKDPSAIVVDELVGMAISLIPVLFFMEEKYLMVNYFLAFISFRFFDISKLSLVKKAETLPKGWGIMLDDVVAGFFSWGFIFPAYFIIKAIF